MSYYVNDKNDELLEFQLREDAWIYAHENAPAYVFHAPNGYRMVEPLMQYNRWYVGVDGSVNFHEGERKWNQ